MSFQAMIEREHQTIRDALARLTRTRDGDAQQRKRLLRGFRDLLVPHLVAEERTLYPALMATDELRYTILVLFEEHHFIRMVLDDLDESPAGSDQWSARQQVLGEFLLEHLSKEERQLLPRVSSSSRESVRELARRFGEARKLAGNGAGPAASSGVSGNKPPSHNGLRE